MDLYCRGKVKLRVCEAWELESNLYKLGVFISFSGPRLQSKTYCAQFNGKIGWQSESHQDGDWIRFNRHKCVTPPHVSPLLTSSCESCKNWLLVVEGEITINLFMLLSPNEMLLLQWNAISKGALLKDCITLGIEIILNWGPELQQVHEFYLRLKHVGVKSGIYDMKSVVKSDGKTHQEILRIVWANWKVVESLSGIVKGRGSFGWLTILIFPVSAMLCKLLWMSKHQDSKNMSLYLSTWSTEIKEVFFFWKGRWLSFCNLQIEWVKCVFVLNCALRFTQRAWCFLSFTPVFGTTSLTVVVCQKANHYPKLCVQDIDTAIRHNMQIWNRSHQNGMFSFGPE